MTNFEQFCDEAFTRRSGSTVPLLGWFIDNYNHSKYETRPLEDGLRTVFSENQFLFGGRRSRDVVTDTKVGVVATTSAGKSVLLSNYNRVSAQKRKSSGLTSIFAN